MKRVIVAGAQGSLGRSVCRTLAALGIQVSAFVPLHAVESTVASLNDLREVITVVPVDVWNPASLRGKGRGHHAVVHLVGGLKQDVARGMTFHHLNTISSRHTVRMAVDDGVPNYLFASTAARPFGVAPQYLSSKRDAETYLRSSGLAWLILRMPPLVETGARAHGLYGLVAAFAGLPLFSLALVNHRPMSIQRAAWGICAALLHPKSREHVLHPPQIRQLGRALERTTGLPPPKPRTVNSGQAGEIDDPPFGWLP